MAGHVLVEVSLHKSEGGEVMVNINFNSGECELQVTDEKGEKGCERYLSIPDISTSEW